VCFENLARGAQPCPFRAQHPRVYFQILADPALIFLSKIVSQRRSGTIQRKGRRGLAQLRGPAWLQFPHWCARSGKNGCNRRFPRWLAAQRGRRAVLRNATALAPGTFWGPAAIGPGYKSPPPLGPLQIAALWARLQTAEHLNLALGCPPTKTHHQQNRGDLLRFRMNVPRFESNTSGHAPSGRAHLRTALGHLVWPRWTLAAATSGPRARCACSLPPPPGRPVLWRCGDGQCSARRPDRQGSSFCAIWCTGRAAADRGSIARRAPDRCPSSRCPSSRCSPAAAAFQRQRSRCRDLARSLLGQDAGASALPHSVQSSKSLHLAGCTH